MLYNNYHEFMPCLSPFLFVYFSVLSSPQCSAPQVEFESSDYVVREGDDPTVEVCVVSNFPVAQMFEVEISSREDGLADSPATGM